MKEMSRANVVMASTMIETEFLTARIRVVRVLPNVRRRTPAQRRIRMVCLRPTPIPMEMRMEMGLEMEMGVEMARGMEMGMEMVIFGAPKASWEVIFDIPNVSWAAELGSDTRREVMRTLG